MGNQARARRSWKKNSSRAIKRAKELLTRERKRIFSPDSPVQLLVKALEAGNYDARPGELLNGCELVDFVSIVEQGLEESYNKILGQ